MTAEVPPMRHGAAWTPATRPGIVPLRPLGFGTILGRSFTALRHNPKVLLGFALGVQAVALLAVTGVLVAAGIASFSRLATLQPGTDDFDTVMAGSIALVGILGVVVTVAATALSTVVQGIVVVEVSRAVVAEKLSVRLLWRRVRPVAWRLVAFGLLVTLALVITVAIVFGTFFALSSTAGIGGFLIALLLSLALIPLWLWLGTKLMLVPAIIAIERASIGAAVGRSWRLMRGRFWVGLGVTVIVNASFGALAQVVSVPFSLVSTGFTTVLTPTGEADVATVVAFLIGGVVTQLVVFVLQCVSLVVLATASSLVYVDARMRHEGLDLDLLSYVDHRDAGASDLPDPFTQHIGRVVPSRWAPPAHWGPPGAPAGGQPGHPAWPAPAWSAPAHWPAPTPSTAPHAPVAAAPDRPATQWTPPGAGAP